VIRRVLERRPLFGGGRVPDYVYQSAGGMTSSLSLFLFGISFIPRRGCPFLDFSSFTKFAYSVVAQLLSGSFGCSFASAGFKDPVSLVEPDR